MMHIPYNNYKTQKCKFFEQNQYCKFGKNCTFAHGPEEMRQPYEEISTDDVINLSMRNPSAFRLHATQQKVKPRVILNDGVNEIARKRILEANALMQSGQAEMGLAIIQAMLSQGAVSIQYSPEVLPHH